MAKTVPSVSPPELSPSPIPPPLELLGAMGFVGCELKSCELLVNGDADGTDGTDGTAGSRADDEAEEEALVVLVLVMLNSTIL